MKTSSIARATSNLTHHWECISLIAITFILFLPVINNPHWGQFDDAVLSLQNGRRALDDPSFTRSLLTTGGTRVGIFLWAVTLWKVFAGNPAGYYITNFVIFAATACLLYWICFQLTRKRFLSAISSACIFTAAGLFEVIYTLDKQELFLPLLFAIVILAHIYSLTCRKFTFFIDLMLCLVCSVASYYTKECSAILCVFSASFFLAVLLSSKKLVDPQAKIAVAKTAVFSIATIAPYLYIHGLTPPTNGYIQLTFVPAVLLRKFWLLVNIDPVFFVILVLVTVSWLKLTFSRDTDRSQLWWRALTACTVSTWITIAALLCYDTGRVLLLYIWLPVYAFLLPAFACSLDQLKSSTIQLRIRKFVLVAVLIATISQLPARAVQGQFQFQMDALMAALSEQLAEMARQKQGQVLGAMPFFETGNSEVPEQLECYVRSRLQQNYYDKKTEKTDQYKFAMLNFLSTDCRKKHLESDPADVFRLEEFRGVNPAYKDQCPTNYVGWSGIQLLAASTPEQNMVRRPFAAGNLLLVPYGDITHAAIRYRGSGIFSYLWQSQLFVFPQLTLQERGNVERKITLLGGHRRTMGWRIFEVTDSQPLAAKLKLDGLLSDDEPLFYKYDESKPVLKIKIREPFSAPITCTFFDGTKITVSKESGSNAIFDIPLKDGAEAKKPLWLKLKSSDSSQIIYVDKMELSTRSKSTI
ncbi:MAG: hypothetical protein JST89_09460 [Cyanobacteria bacterium SZAS-4]|nr:hypothetical protein [Cyanobacteria bacterium SZAS-4]